MDADAALIEAWSLGEDDDGWSDEVIRQAEGLLPVLIEAGYVETSANTWSFTPEGVARAMELQQASVVRGDGFGVGFLYDATPSEQEEFVRTAVRRNAERKGQPVDDSTIEQDVRRLMRAFERIRDAGSQAADGA